jgi:hypothetical protein
MNPGGLDKGKFEAIEAYLLGTLPADERARFEATMANDPELRREVEMQGENMLTVELGAFTRTVRDIAQGMEHADEPPADLHKWTSWTRVLAYAATIVLLLSAVAWWMQRPTLNERLYSEYHVTDPGLPVPMSIVSDPEFHDAMVAYRMGEYEEARVKWSQLLQADPTSDTLRYFIGSAALAAGHAEEAVPFFEGVAREPSSVFHAQAQWYLFLAYLRTDRTDELNAMALDDDPTYGERVRAIKAQLDK